MRRKLYKIKSTIKKKLRLLKNNLLKGSRKFNQQVFTEIYEKDLFNSRSQNDNSVSKSGSGSDLEQTREIVDKLPALLKKYNIKSILDAPCGDFYWMRHIDLSGIDYTGGDIVSGIVARNNREFANESKRFSELDVVNDTLPKVDLIICRDLLVHLKNDQIRRALKNMRNSGSKYLLTTSFKNTQTNVDNGTIGYWRTINLALPPFKMTDSIDEIFENCTEGDGKYNDKYLLLYQLNQ
ncbi:MAG: class I SAM-dependent methyltransferase [Flavobacterium sp.]|nr:MAG: class I SAM-dependent methyltransferase [Flavobacterium sp.]